jgi:DNA-directed RNA polymerase specialized sigma24 family protein
VGAGREEQLWAILDAIEHGESFTESYRQKLDRLPRNRGKKYLRLLGRVALITPAVQAAGHSRVDNSDEIERISQKMSQTEFNVEQRLASGETYAEIAAEIGASTGALKVRVGRWRQRIRGRMLANRYASAAA